MSIVSLMVYSIVLMVYSIVLMVYSIVLIMRGINSLPNTHPVRRTGPD
jgi:hypothetical protein